MMGHDMLHNGQAEPCAGDLAPPALIGAVKAFAQTRQVFTLDPRSLIFDAHPDGALLRAWPA